MLLLLLILLPVVELGLDWIVGFLAKFFLPVVMFAFVSLAMLVSSEWNLTFFALDVAALF